MRFWSFFDAERALSEFFVWVRARLGRSMGDFDFLSNRFCTFCACVFSVKCVCTVSRLNVTISNAPALQPFKFHDGY